MKTQTDRLACLLEIIPDKLRQISSFEMDYKPAKEKWSKKEILGHLIDSAANNHQRFIRVQYEPVPVIIYNQNKWNELNHYQELDGHHVINLWQIYNTHLLKIITLIPEANLALECNTGTGKNVTLQFLIIDYMTHLEHHLKQIVIY